MNWLSIQFCWWMPTSIHSFSPHFAIGDEWNASGRMLGSGIVICPISRASFSWSTSTDQSRSVSPFHCDVFAFS